jgi:isocitrate dehydrogenase
MISNRGIKVWPNGFSETFCTDHWRMRYMCTDEKAHLQFNNKMITRFLDKVSDAGLEFIKTEHLFKFDGVEAFSLGQGQ